jgi:hypothetical protein
MKECISLRDLRVGDKYKFVGEGYVSGVRFGDIVTIEDIYPRRHCRVKLKGVDNPKVFYAENWEKVETSAGLVRFLERTK